MHFWHTSKRIIERVGANARVDNDKKTNMLLLRRMPLDSLLLPFLSLFVLLIFAPLRGDALLDDLAFEPALSIVSLTAVDQLGTATPLTSGQELHTRVGALCAIARRCTELFYYYSSS